MLGEKAINEAFNINQFDEENMTEEDKQDEFDWHVEGLKKWIIEGIEGTDPLSRHNTWEEILQCAIDEVIQEMKNSA